MGIGGDRIPPKWEGWLSHKYDDYEDSNFVDHFYIIEHSPATTLTDGKHYSPGSISPFSNRNRKEFIAEQTARKYTHWDGMTSDIKGFDGKKILISPNDSNVVNKIVDPMTKY